MNSFFDIFRWDRFVSSSAVEVLFWLLAGLSILGGAYGVITGVQLLASDEARGLIAIAGSIIGGVAGMVLARILCEAVVILFRVNDSLADIADRIAETAVQDEIDPVRTERRVAEAARPSSGRSGASRSRWSSPRSTIAWPPPRRWTTACPSRVWPSRAAGISAAPNRAIPKLVIPKAVMASRAAPSRAPSSRVRPSPVPGKFARRSRESPSRTGPSRAPRICRRSVARIRAMAR